MMVVVGNAVPVTAGRNVLWGPVCLLPATTSSVARTDAAGTAVNVGVVKIALLVAVNSSLVTARNADQMVVVGIVEPVQGHSKSALTEYVSVFQIVRINSAVMTGVGVLAGYAQKTANSVRKVTVLPSAGPTL